MAAQNQMMMAQMMMMGKGKGKGDMMGMMMGKGMGKGGSWKATMDKINKVDPEKKAFISNLPEDTKWKDLMTLFTEGGHKPGLTETMSNGTGVVCFRDAAQAAAAITALDQ